MFCKPNHITFIDEITWSNLQTEQNKKLTWYNTQVGYISRTVRPTDTCKMTYLHQFIMNHYGKEKGGESIDHINQNKLDNRTNNLRVVSQSIQNENRGKVSRHKNARDLPAEIQGKLPKYCVYYKEATNKDKTCWREFFTIEGHPAQCGKRVATTKSNKISIIDKLNMAKIILESLYNISIHANLLEEQTDGQVTEL